jgi:MFS family permease
MIRIVTPAPHLPRPVGPSRVRKPVPVPPQAPQLVYDRPFWLAYISYALLTSALALMYRYADFVSLLGGTEFHLGWIVGVGMIGSLAMRLTLGSWIDRFGARIVWLIATVAFAVICFGHLVITSYSGIAIYAARIGYCCAMAGAYGASITFVTSRAPSQRIAESMGMLGSAGFLGTVLGPLLGDAMFSLVPGNHLQIQLMFIVAGLLALISLPFAWGASRHEKPPKPETGTHSWTLIRRYSSGMAMLMGVVMGMGLSFPGTFLRSFAADLSIPRIGAFFFVFSVSAFTMRIITRHWFERFGNRRMILLGMIGLAGSHLLLLAVHTEWLLILPAIAFGASQAVVLPAIMAAGSVVFPNNHRGLAMVLMLATSDFGQLIGAPLMGEVLHCSHGFGLPPYPTLFLVMAGLLAASGVWGMLFAERKAAQQPTEHPAVECN